MPLTSAEKEILVELGNEIRRFRSNRGLSQEDLAALMDLSTRQLQNLEMGRKAKGWIAMLRLFGLMKRETRKSFTERCVTKTQTKLGVKPIRRSDTYLGEEDRNQIQE